MNWLRRFMAGRYGGDQLSIALIILSLLLSLIGQITNISFIILLNYIPLIISIYRIFSKDIRKRSMENYKFAMIMSPVYSKFNRLKNRIKSRIRDRKTHRFFKCPSCKTRLRLPKGKGKIIITCPKCKTRFEERT